jgi:lipopolysaccharide/colanic/teichoic acid biosynthesis glycosyltransferase
MSQEGWRFAVKRAVDVSFAATCLVTSAPLMAAVAIAVRLSMGAPVLFRQTRPGLRGQPFTLYKFRTMSGGAGPDERRLTRLGRLLRAASVDELPQLLNVLRGDMSLVGPRPLLMAYLDRYTPEQARRHDVLPGITGWAQVNGRNALTHEQRFALDCWYVDNWSPWLDFRILFRTFLRVFSGAGISSEGHATMPEFMGSGAGASNLSIT